MPRLARLLPLLAITLVISAEDAVLEGSDGIFTRVDFKPFYLETDVGTNDRERKKFASGYARTVSANLNHFLRAFGMKAKDFDEFARFYGAESGSFDPAVRIRLWRRFEPFLQDLQTRYDTKAIAGAYKGQIRPKDEYGEFTGPMFREIGVYVEGRSKQEVLRGIYHEMGHLFMQTFIKYPSEVPSWLEEGTAQLFEYRKGNGTDPEPVRQERMAWLYEMVEAPAGEIGSAVPWRDLTKVKNLDNLDFTWQDPLRSTKQYSQVWSMSEFFVDDRRRQAAYMKMLRAMRQAGEDKFIELRRAGKTGEALFKGIRYHLYDIQERIFKQAYGADLYTVEDRWKMWLRKSYEKDVKRNPVLRYHRGTWHLDRVAGVAKDPAVKKAALEKAEAIFNEAVTIEPKDPSGYVGLARLAAARGHQDVAAAHFATANELGTDFFEALVYGGEALLKSGRPDEAIPGLKKALEQRPGHWEAMVFLGQALVIQGEELDRAIELLRSAYHQRNHSSWLGLYEGTAHFYKGDYDAAFQGFARVYMASDQRDPLSAALCALARSRQMEDDETKSWIDRVAQINADLAASLKTQLIDQQKGLEIGFRDDARPGIVGVTLKLEDATVPGRGKGE
jgi:tetratricopeptide (TPR) repeat protein